MKHQKKYLLALLDVVLLALSLYLAMFLRFDGNIPSGELHNVLPHIPVIVLIKIIVYFNTRMYSIYWGYASIREMIQILFATALGNALATAYILFMATGAPRGIIPIMWVLDVVFIGGIRYSIRAKKSMDGVRFFNAEDTKRILILGAGEAGALVSRELMRHIKTLQSEPVAFVDDDPQKLGNYIHGVQVMGDRTKIPELVKALDIDEMIMALPSATKEEHSEILQIAQETGISIKTVPGVYEMIDGSFSISEIREVEIEDLLGREPIELDNCELEQFITGKTILITGGGGSIGSELARQIAMREPKRLVLLDIYENAVYETQQELRRTYPKLDLHVYIDSIRDKSRMEQIFQREKPAVIFHAAAHKHVPLMENSPASAIKNNVFGTLHVAEAAVNAQVERFVMISTDKAVRPTNVMGATKRFCELIINAYNGKGVTEFVAVRFGNVLGSNGSVIPLFKKQIAEGGPVTVTDPEVTRYFMTIPEACQLVLQAGSMAKGGEVFILDMGEPVKIADLARNLIYLSGFKPDEDIKIEYTGLRPGEKLYEELLINDGNATATKHEKIYVEIPPQYDMAKLHAQLEVFMNALYTKDDEQIVAALRENVPSYQPNREN